MISPATAQTAAIARLRLIETTADADSSGYRVVVNLPGSNYQLHLNCDTRLTAGPNGRVIGVIRCQGWKLDYVSAGGAFIEPVMGRPRRVQGRVIGSTSNNALIVEVADTPIITELPQRWIASTIPPGTRVGVDVHDGATFEPAD